MATRKLRKSAKPRDEASTAKVDTLGALLSEVTSSALSASKLLHEGIETDARTDAVMSVCSAAFKKLFDLVDPITRSPAADRIPNRSVDALFDARMIARGLEGTCGEAMGWSKDALPYLHAGQVFARDIEREIGEYLRIALDVPA